MGIVGAALVACVIVGVVVGVLMTSSTGIPRIPCVQIADEADAFPYRFRHVSPDDCVYGYHLDGKCMYDGYYNVTGDDTNEPCYVKNTEEADFGVDHVSGGCYYNSESTCHCNLAYRKDENVCYRFAIKESTCQHGLSTKGFCLYELRTKKSHAMCDTDWDDGGDTFCYTRKDKVCDHALEGSITQTLCLRARSIAQKTAEKSV